MIDQQDVCLGVRLRLCDFSPGQQKVKLDQAVVSLLTWETCGGAVSQKAEIGTATANRGPKVKAFLRPIFRAQCGEPCVEGYRTKLVRRKGVPFSGGLGTWEGVALSCHVALDTLCQEMHEAWWLGCRCQRGLSVTARSAFLSPWTGCDCKREREREKKEGV